MNPSSGSCLICSSNCLECSVTSSNCITCPALTSILNNKCYSPCPASYQSVYVNNILTCVLCSSITQNCATCANNGCTSCISNSYSYINPTNNSLTCVTTCPSGTFIDTASQSCKSCSSVFANCSACNSQYCTQCTANQYLLSNVCYSTCPMGYYANSNTWSCDSCNIGCKSCSSLSNCLICENNLANNGNGTCSSKPNNCTAG
jgi:proprotein convertase subtilisin/kexin type 5